MNNLQGHTLNVEERPARKVKNYMSVYTYPYTWRTWYGFWGNIKSWFTNQVAAKQRAKRGYCTDDVWDCGDSIVNYIINVLCEFRNKAQGYPDQYFDTMEEWIGYIDKIIDLLEYSRQDLDKLNEFAAAYYEVIKVDEKKRTEEEQMTIDKYYERRAEIYEEQAARRKVAFAKLAAHLSEIWW